MDNSARDSILFVESIECYDFKSHSADHIMHILCIEGSMSFVFHNVHYNIIRGDYVIISNVSLCSDFLRSADCRCIVMSFAESFFISMAIRSNYGFIGRFALLQNPVMKLSEPEFDRCLHDLVHLQRRLEERGHRFHEEMIGHLLMAHVLDLYDIHARKAAKEMVPERTAMLLRRFIEMLCQGEYMRHRNLGHYASALFVTPHYLSEICRKISGEPASYWIDRFTISEVVRLLRRKDLPLSEIAEQMNFSSMSYFSRYVQRHIGVSPLSYRRDS